MPGQSVTAVHVRRIIAAPPERVYRAWLDPQRMSRWFAPATFTVRKVEVDERVGGRLRIWHADSNGNDVGGAEAQIVELIPHGGTGMEMLPKPCAWETRTQSA